MASKCSKCNATVSMANTSLELPYDGYCDERSMNLTGCPHCQFHGVGIYTEQRWGPPGDESWNYYEEPCSREAWDELKRLIALCPNPSTYKCDCLAHKKLATVKSGRWCGLDEFLKEFEKKTGKKDVPVQPKPIVPVQPKPIVPVQPKPVTKISRSSEPPAIKTAKHKTNKKTRPVLTEDIWYMNIALELKKVTDAFIKWLLPPSYFDKEVPNGEQLCYRLPDGHGLIHKSARSTEEVCYEIILNRDQWRDKEKQNSYHMATEATVHAVQAFSKITECEVDEVFSLVPCDFMEPKEVRPAAKKAAEKFQLAERAWALANIPYMENILKNLAMATAYLSELKGAPAHTLLKALHKEIKQNPGGPKARARD
ncbi:MAG: hypothetical protein ABUK01_10050 [Leptospirales bacterium]